LAVKGLSTKGNLIRGRNHPRKLANPTAEWKAQAAQIVAQVARTVTQREGIGGKKGREGLVIDRTEPIAETSEKGSLSEFSV